MRWPRQITNAHATCIPKESQASHDPLANRVLLTMSQIYRQWASMRLKHLAPWIHRWALPQMYAGVLGQGAEQAWWQPSLCSEHWGTKQTQATGGATDIYKCFDQIVRPVVCTMARVAGIPKRILTPYVSIMEALRIRNSLTVGYGALHTRQRGIPQGCPFSMTLTALMVRSCIIQVQKRGAIPRVLVDDLHLVAVGEKHYENYMKAIRDTHMFITTVGGRIAPSKSHAYSTDRRTRKRLHNTRYDILIRQGPVRHVLSRCWGDRSTRPTG